MAVQSSRSVIFLFLASCYSCCVLSFAQLPIEQPNIIFILMDDGDSSLLEFMPNVQAMQAEGASFSNYFVTDSLCCPSRASIFTGLHPHNTGVFTNTGPTGGIKAFIKNGGDAKSFAATLSAQNYKMGFLGKYLNGYNPAKQGPAPGWSTWAAAGSAGYREFNYILNQNGKKVKYNGTQDDYMTDVLNTMAVDFIAERAAAGGPFMIEVAPFAPHSPYVPAPRDSTLFPGLQAPRPPSFNATTVNPPSWLAAVPPLSNALANEIDVIYRKRAQSVVAIDKLVGDVRRQIAALGLQNTTWVFFSSDNGFHLGHWRGSAGKQTPYTTDIRVPLVVVGPGVEPGRIFQRIVQSTDLCPTFAELAGAPTDTSDGVSLVPLLRGERIIKWRDVALVEHGGFADAADPDNTPGKFPANFLKPTPYKALRGADYLYVEYNNGEFEYHDLITDPHEMNNSYASLEGTVQDALHVRLQALQLCQGAECHVPV